MAAEKRELEERYENSTNESLGASLASTLFDEIYKDEPEKLQAVAQKLGGLEKPEIMALDEFVCSQRRLQHWRETINAVAALAGLA